MKRSERGRGCVLLVILWLMQVFFLLGAVYGAPALAGVQPAPPRARGSPCLGRPTC